MKNIIFISPPAGGKGTQSKLLENDFGYVHISTGDLLREEINKKTNIGQSIKDKMDKGLLIEDSIIINLLKSKLESKECDNGYILDGYPRNISQAQNYEEILTNINRELGVVIFLDIDKDLALERAVGRITCEKCGASYNILKEKLKPIKDGECNYCHSSLKVRSDDNEETFLKRFNTYVNSTKELIDYYKDKGVLHTIKIDDNKSTDEVFNEIKEIIND